MVERTAIDYSEGVEEVLAEGALHFVAVVLDHVQLLVRCCRRIGFPFRKSQGDFATDLSTGLPYLAEVLSLFEDSR